MGKYKSSVFENGLVWFGAAVSIAEIETGALIANSGFSSFSSAIWAIVLGHAIGGAILFLMGLIGAKYNLSSMDSVKAKFGKCGGGFFSVMNILQLIGWTSVMIAQGAAALSVLFPMANYGLACVIIGLLVAGWLYVGLGNFLKVNTISMALLFVLTFYICIRLFGRETASIVFPENGLGFWEIMELSIAMPVSWLPLISDYTKGSKKPVLGTLASASIYTIVSTWMYGIGFCAVLFLKEASFAKSLSLINAGLIGGAIIVFSTVTTTFLDAYSAGESSKSLFVSTKQSAKLIGVGVCAVGIFTAIYSFMDHYSSFLYLIASVFAPMAAVLIADWFVVKKSCIWISLIAWISGFISYHFFLGGTSPLPELIPQLKSCLSETPSVFGATLPSMTIAFFVSMLQFCTRQGNKR